MKLAEGGIVTRPTVAVPGCEWEGAVIPEAKYREMEAEFKKRCPDGMIHLTALPPSDSLLVSLLKHMEEKDKA